MRSFASPGITGRPSASTDAHGPTGRASGRRIRCRFARGAEPASAGNVMSCSDPAPLVGWADMVSLSVPDGVCEVSQTLADLSVQCYGHPL